MKTEILRARVTPDIFKQITIAAKVNGCSVSEYLRIAVTEKAKRDLKGKK